MTQVPRSGHALRRRIKLALLLARRPALVPPMGGAKQRGTSPLGDARGAAANEGGTGSTTGGRSGTGRDAPPTANRRPGRTAALEALGSGEHETVPLPPVTRGAAPRDESSVDTRPITPVDTRPVPRVGEPVNTAPMSSSPRTQRLTGLGAEAAEAARARGLPSTSDGHRAGDATRPIPPVAGGVAADTRPVSPVQTPDSRTRPMAPVQPARQPGSATLPQTSGPARTAAGSGLVPPARAAAEPSAPNTGRRSTSEPPGDAEDTDASERVPRRPGLVTQKLAAIGSTSLTEDDGWDDVLDDEGEP